MEKEKMQQLRRSIRKTEKIIKQLNEGKGNEEAI